MQYWPQLESATVNTGCIPKILQGTTTNNCIAHQNTCDTVCYALLQGRLHCNIAIYYCRITRCNRMSKSTVYGLERITHKYYSECSFVFLALFCISTVSHSYLQYLCACQIWEKSLNDRSLNCQNNAVRSMDWHISSKHFWSRFTRTVLS